MNNSIDTQAPFPSDFDWNEAYAGEATDYVAPDADIVRAVDALPPGRALDVGCGSGGLLAHMAERGWSATGVDIADKAIAAARGVLEARGVKAELHVADASEWAPGGPYDLITSSFALPVTPEGRAVVFARMRGALADGGTIVIKEFDDSMQRHTIFSEMQLPTLDEAREAFDGLKVERAELVDASHDEQPEAGDDERWTAMLFIARA